MRKLEFSEDGAPRMSHVRTWAPCCLGKGVILTKLELNSPSICAFSFSVILTKWGCKHSARKALSPILDAPDLPFGTSPGPIWPDALGPWVQLERTYAYRIGEDFLKSTSHETIRYHICYRIGEDFLKSTSHETIRYPHLQWVTPPVRCSPFPPLTPSQLPSSHLTKENTSCSPLNTSFLSINKIDNSNIVVLGH
jgi:hypothetical protein